MENAEADVLSRLGELGIAYRLVTHPPVYTIAECGDVGAVGPKNLFLAPRRQHAFWLLTVMPDAVMNTGSVSKQLGSPRLSFAPEEKLTEFTRARNGSASPLGLMFDTQNNVRFAMDVRLRDLVEIAFHPCVNTATVVLKTADFFNRFLPAAGHDVIFVDMEIE